MRPAIRKPLLVLHMSCSIGWIGAVAAFLVLSIAGLTSRDSDVVRGVYQSMDLVSRFAVIPLCLASLSTGLVQALAGAWGLRRYYWVATKLGLASLATTALLVHQFAFVGEAAKRASGAMSDALFSPEFVSLKNELVLAPSMAILVLLTATTLAVYKPWGPTAYGRRQQMERLGRAPPVEVAPGGRLKLVLTIVVAVIVGLVVLKHLSGGLSAHMH